MTDHQTEAPLPCPWCSGNAIALRSRSMNGDNHWVACYSARTCGVCGPAHDTEAEAIAAWNRVVGQQWRPIKTAPADGQDVFLWWPHWSSHPVIGHCLSSGRWQSRAALSAGDDDPGPTHWRPLPPPPARGDGT